MLCIWSICPIGVHYQQIIRAYRSGVQCLNREWYRLHTFHLVCHASIVHLVWMWLGCSSSLLDILHLELLSLMPWSIELHWIIDALNRRTNSCIHCNLILRCQTTIRSRDFIIILCRFNQIAWVHLALDWDYAYNLPLLVLPKHMDPLNDPLICLVTHLYIQAEE